MAELSEKFQNGCMIISRAPKWLRVRIRIRQKLHCQNCTAAVKLQERSAAPGRLQERAAAKVKLQERAAAAAKLQERSAAPVRLQERSAVPVRL